jgi:hypothetical protein
MHRLIADEAGHPLVAAVMRHVDHGATGLERLAGERRAEARRQAAVTVTEPRSGASDGEPSTDDLGGNLRVP